MARLRVDGCALCLRARQCDCCPAGFSVEAHATAWQVPARPQLAVPWTRCEPAEASLPHLALLTALAPSFAVQRDDYDEALRLLRARPLGHGHGIAFDIFRTSSLKHLEIVSSIMRVRRHVLQPRATQPAHAAPRGTRRHTTCRRRGIVQALELKQAGRRWPPHEQRRTRPRGVRWSCTC